MSSAFIPKALRQRIAKQAHHRCGYCQTTELLIGAPMEIDHIIPVALGGRTEENNFLPAQCAINTKVLVWFRLTRSPTKLCHCSVLDNSSGPITLPGAQFLNVISPPNQK
jgi:hypothetical protein